MRSAFTARNQKSTASSRSMSSTWKTSRRCVTFAHSRHGPHHRTLFPRQTRHAPESQRRRRLGAGNLFMCSTTRNSASSWACSRSMAIKTALASFRHRMKKIHAPDDLWPWLDRLGDDQSSYLLEQFIPGSVFHVDRRRQRAPDFIRRSPCLWRAAPQTFHTVEASSRRAHFLAKPGNRATSQPQPKPDAGPRSRSRRYYTPNS